MRWEGCKGGEERGGGERSVRKWQRKKGEERGEEGSNLREDEDLKETVTKHVMI